MQPRRMLVTDAAELPPRQSSVWLIMTLGRRMKMRVISEAEYNTIATTCSPSADPDHSDTFWALSAEIEEALSVLGVPHEGMGGGDFWMNHSFTENRRLSIELNSSKMMDPRLLSIIQALLSRHVERWRVDIMHDVLEMPYFFLLVYKDECLMVEDDDAEASIKLFTE